MERRTDWYAHPEYYEAIFGADTEREMDFLFELNRRFGTGGTHWLEPACGAGRLLQAGVRRGLSLTGYDVSAPMLDYARARLRPADRKRVGLFQARMEDFAPRELRHSFDLAYSLVSTFRYVDTQDGAVAHLRAIRSLLRPGGLYVLGFHLTDYARSDVEHERWTGRAGQDRVVCNTREWPPERARRRSRMRNRLRVRGPGKDWLIETAWYFRTWDATQAQQLFIDSGFDVVARYTFDYDIDDPQDWERDRLDSVFVLG